MTMDNAVSTEELLTWTTNNVAKWLMAIGLEKYANKFKRYLVTGPVLLQLDEALLDDLNVISMNDREVLLEAVTHFSGNIEKPLVIRTNCVSLNSDDNENEEKETVFPGFAELLPTIEEDELEGEVGIEESSKCLSSTEEEVRSKENTNQDVKEYLMNKLKEEPGDVNHGENKMAITTNEKVSNPETKDDQEVASRATQIVQVFSEENMYLRKQLEKCYQQIKHLQNTEKDLRNTQIMYKDLKSAFINREHKEKAMRLRMEAEIAQLQNINDELTDELRETQDIISRNPIDELKNLKEQINKRDEEVKQLQAERKMSKSSLQNLERLLKQKSSEIITLQQQWETLTCSVCGSKMETKQLVKTGLKKSVKPRDVKISPLNNPEQFHHSMQTSSNRDSRLSPNCSFGKQRFRFPSQNAECSAIQGCVPILVELLREKNTEIDRLRKEINQTKLRTTEETEENLWLQIDSSDGTNRISDELNENNKTFGKYRNAKRRYLDLEKAIRSLHVQLAEKDAVIKILQCKYGEGGINHCHSLSDVATPFRTPSFTSQVSSVSSYQDSGIATSSDYHSGEVSYQERTETIKVEESLSSDREFKTNNEQDVSVRQQEDQSLEHCWFF